MTGRLTLSRWLTGPLMLAALLLAEVSPAASAAQELTYRLILKHGIVGTKRMGTQVIKVTPVDSATASYDVETRMKIDFTPFIFNHVKVQQVTREVWRNGQIVSFQSKTNDRGKKYEVVIQQNGNQLAVKSGDNTSVLTAAAVPSSYWYEPLFKERSQLFDTMTGESEAVKLEFVGMAQAKYRGGRLPVRHYRMAENPSKRELWYFETGIMFMTRWEEDEGGTVTYVLE